MEQVAAESGQLKTDCKAAGETILLVEDDPDVRRLVRMILKRMGYTVVAAADAAEALEAMARTPTIDLLFTDVVLPNGVNGPALAKEAARRRPGLKVIYMSGYPADAFKDEGDSLLAGMMLQKPFQRAELADAVRLTLDGECPP